MLEAIVISILGSTAVAIWFDRRSRYQKDIADLLTQCRETEGWDEKSESKLWQWMPGVAEDQVHNCNLRKLYEIRRSLRDYLHVHLWGWDPGSAPGRVELLLRSILIRMESRRQNKVHNRRSCKGKKRRGRKKEPSTYLTAKRK